MENGDKPMAYVLDIGDLIDYIQNEYEVYISRGLSASGRMTMDECGSLVISLMDHLICKTPFFNLFKLEASLIQSCLLEIRQLLVNIPIHANMVISLNGNSTVVIHDKLIVDNENQWLVTVKKSLDNGDYVPERLRRLIHG